MGILDDAISGVVGDDMISALFSFLGGSAFRMLWGEISSWLSKKQDHEFEMARLQFQEQADAAKHGRDMEAIKVQAELGVKTIQVAAEGEVGKIETSAWLEAVKGTTVQTGIRWVDAWNATIRPGVATWAILMLTANEFGLFVMSAFSLEICGAALGLYLADRTLAKRGK